MRLDPEEDREPTKVRRPKNLQSITSAVFRETMHSSAERIIAMLDETLAMLDGGRMVRSLDGADVTAEYRTGILRQREDWACYLQTTEQAT